MRTAIVYEMGFVSSFSDYIWQKTRYVKIKGMLGPEYCDWLGERVIAHEIYTLFFRDPDGGISVKIN